jgi:DNA adenine methylase
MIIPKPILKWVGGKTQIIDKILPLFPTEINNYHEPFLGGGSILFALLTYVHNNIIKINGNIYAYDINEPLIYVYKNIQSHHIELYNTLQSIITEFNQSSKEDYYYSIRNKYNHLSIEDKNSILGSALFIFLNKTCFRGLFRTSSNGFNVPFGHYKNPEIINKNHLQIIHNLIQNVIFDTKDFTQSLSLVQNNDFIYLDPPYVPEKSTSFVNYTKDGFNIQHHTLLFNLINDLHIKFILSNSDVDFVRESFINDKYNITSIICKRSIHSKNPNSKTKELIIKNY